MIEMKGQSYNVDEAHEQLQNVVDVLTSRLPYCKVVVAVFSRQRDPIIGKRLRAKRVRVGNRTIPIQIRECGDAVVSLHSMLRS